MSRLSHRSLAIVVLLLLAAFALRLFRLDFQSIWWDEGISLHLATSSLAGIVRDRLDNIHPPLYFFILKGWLGLTGVSAFSGRYLSALAALIQVPLVFAFTRYLMRRIGSARQREVAPVAWIAAGLIVIAPLSVIYGQEIRVYAFLPAIFIALIWLGERLITQESLDWRPLLLLGAVEWLGLHLHYIVAFGVAYVALWGLLTFSCHRRWDLVGRWMGLHLAVALASLPWFVAVLGNWQAVQAEASAGTFATEPVPLAFLFAQVWAFQLTGLAGALGTPLVRVLAGVTAVIFVVLVSLRAGRWDRRHGPRPRASDTALWAQRLRLLAHWSVPLTLALVVWSLRSFSHPRYVTMYTIAFVPLAAALVWPARRWATRIVAALFGVLLVALSLWGLQRYFFNPNAAKADMRGVAAYLSMTAEASDIIVVPDTDWSLNFEYRGSAEIVMADGNSSPLGFPESLDGALGCGGTATGPGECAEPRQVYAVDYERGTRDWQNRVPFELERRGSLVGTVEFDDLIVRHYALNHTAGALPACPDAGFGPVNFGGLTLQSAWVEEGAAADSAVAVALCWQATVELDETYQAALTLIDPLTHEQVGQAALPLRDGQGRPSSTWAVGEPIVTYHLVPVTPGSPPLAYDLMAAVFALDGDLVEPVEVVDLNGLGAGQQAVIGQAILAAPFGLAANPYHVAEPPPLAEPIAVGPGVALAGVVIGGGTYRPGQTLRVGLLWEGTGAEWGDFQPEIRLEQDGRFLAANTEPPAQGRYPAEVWQTGERVREVRDLRLPAGADGSVQVVVQTAAGPQILGTVEVAGSNVLLSMPDAGQLTDARFGDVATLAGFTLAKETVISGESLPLTLVWQSRSSEIGADYVVFAHLVDPQGNLIGQHDGLPDGGQRPTSDWLDGEFISDLHAIAFREPGYSGPAAIRVGLYDPDTGTRLQLLDGSDAFTLPASVHVVSEP